ncbi:MAG: redoxin domain-containing protein [Candidatus Wallbacteria bacterium]|nr:redoxin domain-containing protein [Candidatus Wallbacteria bacterium]
MTAFEGDLETFEELGAQVLGISVDSIPSHKEWAKSLGGLNYPLLSDFWPHGGTATKYGVLTDQGYCQRSIFVVGLDGKIGWSKVWGTGVPDNKEICSILQPPSKSASA